MKRPNNPESQNARNPRRTPGFLATKNLATQFAIGDINDVDFGNFEGGVGVSAGESSKINILSPGIFGNGSRFGSASDLSQGRSAAVSRSRTGSNSMWHSYPRRGIQSFPFIRPAWMADPHFRARPTNASIPL
jgi:hypothetical protein